MSISTIPGTFFLRAEACKEKPAFHYFDKGWKSLTYEELTQKTKGIAAGLIRSGVAKGDRVAILSENRPEWCIAYLGVSLAGGVGVPLDIQLGPQEIGNLLADSGAKVVFHSAGTEENIRKSLHILSTDSGGEVLQISFESPEFEEMSTSPALEQYPAVSGDDTASIIYTSGTTGVPKGVMLSHSNFCADAAALIKVGIISENDCVIGVLPLHHTYPFMGNLILPVFLGIPVTYPQSLKGPDIMAAMKEKGVSILVSVPQLLDLIRSGILRRITQLHAPLPKIMLGVLKICGGVRRRFGLNPGKLVFRSAHRALGERFRFFACGGAKLDPQVMKDLEAIGFTVLEGYGLTETSPVVTFNPIEKRKPGSVGKPLPTAEVKIVDPATRRAVGPMQEGEIVLKGPMLMRGYYKNPRATAQVIKDGWFFSGDLGYVDEDGYVIITGRLKEMIVLSSGKNVYPDEVEKHYLQIPLIKEICVTGIEEKGMTESLRAVVVPDLEYAKKAQIGNLQEALKWAVMDVSQGLPPYMRIKGYTLFPEPLPRTPLGKLRRFMVQDILKQRTGEMPGVREEDGTLAGDAVAKRVVECISPLMKEERLLQGTDNLELDLGLDSLGKIELIVLLEKMFSVKLPDTFLSDVQTVQDLVQKVRGVGTGQGREVHSTGTWKQLLTADPELHDRKKVGLHHGKAGRLILVSGLLIVKAVMKILFRLKVHGIAHIPEKGPYIITPNHVSYLDGFSVGAALPTRIFEQLFSLGMQKFFTGAFKGSFARLAHVIPIDTESSLNKAMQISAYVLRSGKSLIIFPEGGRSFDGELMEFKKGVGILSTELDVPVIPAYINGTFKALPRGAVWPRFSEIRVEFGKPLHPSEIDMSGKPQDLDEYQFFVNELRQRVRRLHDLNHQ